MSSILGILFPPYGNMVSTIRSHGHNSLQLPAHPSTSFKFHLGRLDIMVFISLWPAQAIGYCGLHLFLTGPRAAM
jgi:hypothetical protein